MSKPNYRFETLQVHAGQETPDLSTGASVVPIYQTTGFVFKDFDQAAGRFSLSESGNIYTRIMNPTTDVFEQRIAALEGGVGALALASGQAATTYAILNIARAGDHIVADRCIYGGTYNLFANTLRDYGIETTFVDNDVESFERAVQPNTKAFFFESIANPCSTIVDIEAVSKVARKHGIPIIVDNTFATPYLLRPIEYGANIIVHSATKYIDGHGSTIGGVIVDGGNFDWAQNDKFPGLSLPNPNYHGAVFTQVAGAAAFIVKARTTLLRDIGAALSPFNSFLYIRGLETLSLRIERHVENALKVVDYLEKHPRAIYVSHPALPHHKDHELYKRYFPNGASSCFAFDVEGGRDGARTFIDSLKLFSLVANVADTKSLVIHPASTTHSQLNEDQRKAIGITQGTVRLSIGTEHIDDIIDDLEQALGCLS